MVHPLLSSPARALMTLGALIALPYVVPATTPLVPWPKGALRASRFRLLTPLAPAEQPAPAVNAPVDTVGAVELSAPTDDRPRDEGDAVAAKRPLFGGSAAPVGSAEAAAGEHPFVDPSGHALDAVYRAFAGVEAGGAGARARVLYYGDSIVAADWVTATLRKKLQRRFGDAGHGFVLLANAWPGYFHNNVRRYATEGWKVSRVVGPYASDGLYGLGGVSFVAEGAGTYAGVATSDKGEFGKTVSRFVVTYATAPNGGDFRLRVDKGDPLVVTTRASEVEVREAEVRVADGPHELELRSEGHGPVRAFGVDLERDAPGVIVDALGIVGCRLRFLDKSDDVAWASELRRRAPALVALQYGANESEDGFAYPMADYEVSARAVYRQVREAVPAASCLIVGPLDRVDRRGDVFTTRDVIPAMNEIQRRLAAEMGCAFFDTFKAMGGKGSMGKWYLRGLGGSDLVHPTTLGAEAIGTWIDDALMRGYAAYRASLGGPAAASSEAPADSAIPPMPNSSAAPAASD